MLQKSSKVLRERRRGKVIAFIEGSGKASWKRLYRNESFKD